MMLRIAQAPDWDTQNEGKTLTPYWAAEVTSIPLAFLLDRAERYLDFSINDWKFEVLHETKPD